MIGVTSRCLTQLLGIADCDGILKPIVGHLETLIFKMQREVKSSRQTPSGVGREVRDQAENPPSGVRPWK